MKDNKLFLLGGYDLEMLEIKSILKGLYLKYEDKKLSWGAKLSEYEEFLGFEGDIYGIELEEDITPPSSYHAIDHHGKYDSNPSSLEQVAEHLHVELTRKQQLIAANDSRYIAGMKALCATNEEIEEIRKADREAQGVIEEDEKLADKSIQLSYGSATIFSYTEHFSIISDKVFEKHEKYIIYNNTKVNFYGYNRSLILDFLKDQTIDKEEYYYGGGEFGFVGIKANKYTEHFYKDLINKLHIFEENRKTEIYSYHTFMFPFRWDKANSDDNSKIEDKIKIDKEFHKMLIDAKWIYKPFPFNMQKEEILAEHYNEYTYFHEFARDAIYNLKDDFEENQTVYFYEKDYTNGEIKLAIYGGKTYSLKLDGLSLRIYDTGVAILSFDVENNRYRDLEDVLKINDYFRRVYPQFLGKTTPFTLQTKKAFLPCCVSIKLPDKNLIEEKFENNYTSIPKKIQLSKLIMEVLGEGLFIEDENQKAKDKIKIRHIVDDRMFVLSWFGNDIFSKSLNKWDEFAQNYSYENSDDWYRYVFVDGNDKTVQSKKLQKELINNATYDRWIEYSTVYGITRYSFVCVSENNEYTKNVLPLPHMQTMYYQMFHLLLAQRASILRFSDEASNIATFKDNGPDLFKKSQSLYTYYIKFINKLYYREVTAQDQGIEIYNKAQIALGLSNEIKDLDNEIEELHSYVSIEQEKARSDSLEIISKIGAILVPPSLIASIFGMNILTFEGTYFNQFIGLITIIFSGLLGFLFITNKQFRMWKILKMAIGFVIIPIVLFILMFSIFDQKHQDHNDNHKYHYVAKLIDGNVTKLHKDMNTTIAAESGNTECDITNQPIKTIIVKDKK